MHDRKTMCHTKATSSDAAGVLLIPGDESRIAIILAPPVGRSVLVKLGPDSGGAIGVPIPSGSQPLILTREELGDSVGQAITLTDSAGAAVTFTYIEVLSSL